MRSTRHRKWETDAARFCNRLPAEDAGREEAKAKANAMKAEAIRPPVRSCGSVCLKLPPPHAYAKPPSAWNTSSASASADLKAAAMLSGIVFRGKHVHQAKQIWPSQCVTRKGRRSALGGKRKGPPPLLRCARRRLVASATRASGEDPQAGLACLP